jgi:aminopeptidase YwaD
MNIKKIIVVLFLITNSINAQVLIQEYENIVKKATQANINKSLTDFEGLGVKRRGTPALQNTLNWLKNNYLSYGYTASQMVEDSYTYSGSTAVCKNLIVTKIGTVYPNKYVIVCGHYDTIAGTGTNDNGSGTSIILEMARLLQNIPTEYSIKFINFSGEEDGLKGSQHYVNTVVNGTNPKMNIKVVFNIDEVGGVAGKVNNTITCDVDQSTPTSNNAASATITNELAKCVSLYSPLKTFINFADATDYIPFEDNGEIITGLYETNISTKPHTTGDSLVNMDSVYCFNVAKAAIGATLHFAVGITTLGVDDYNENFQVSFFPNPTNDYLTINLGTLTDKNCQFSLIDIHGRVVFEKNIINTNLLEQINVSNFNTGVYLARLTTEDKIVNKKIVIE